MIRLVADASGAVKWVFPFRDDEEDSAKALALLDRFRHGEVGLQQPPHWLAEVAAVISRQSPATAREGVGLLYAMRVPVVDSPEVYALGCELAVASGQHLFDTLYHAVALLSPECTLVTSDERYYRKARRFGSISLLAEVNLS